MHYRDPIRQNDIGACHISSQNWTDFLPFEGSGLAAQMPEDQSFECVKDFSANDMASMR